jgi:hypothetical protein
VPGLEQARPARWQLLAAHALTHGLTLLRALCSNNLSQCRKTQAEFEKACPL